jgi:hypothetical protein
MRIATLIISLVLGLALTVQSCAVYAASSVVGSLSEEGTTDKTEADATAGGGAVGIFMALLWLVAAGFVMAKPKVSMWLFSIAAVFGVIGGATGFSDLFIWAGASALFAAASWRGISEQAKKDEQQRAAYRADVMAAATAVAAVTAQPEALRSMAPPLADS